MRRLRKGFKRKKGGKSPFAGVSTDFKILISLVQVLGSISATFSISFPPIYSNVMQWLSILELNVLMIMPLSCHGVAMNFYNSLVLRTAIPLVFMLCCLLAKVFCRCGSKFEAMADRAMSAAFFILFLLYPTNSQKVFQTFLCQTFDDPEGTKALIADLTLDCRTPTHNLFVAYALIMFIYPFGTPALYSWLVYSSFGTKLKQMKLNETYRVRIREEALADLYHARHSEHVKTLDELKQAKGAKKAAQLAPVAVPTVKKQEVKKRRERPI